MDRRRSELQKAKGGSSQVYKLKQLKRELGNRVNGMHSE